MSAMEHTATVGFWPHAATRVTGWNRPEAANRREQERTFNAHACVPWTIARRRVRESERQCIRLRLRHTPA